MQAKTDEQGEGDEEGDFWGDDQPIYAYTRQDAIADGVLVDVSSVAREAGFKWPVAITSTVHGMIEDIPPSRRGSQDYAGRLWDVLWIAKQVAKRVGGSDPIRYRVIMHHGHRVYAHLKLCLTVEDCGKGEPEPALTIMLPDED